MVGMKMDVMRGWLGGMGGSWVGGVAIGVLGVSGNSPGCSSWIVSRLSAQTICACSARILAMMMSPWRMKLFLDSEGSARAVGLRLLRVLMKSVRSSSVHMPIHMP